MEAKVYQRPMGVIKELETTKHSQDLVTPIKAAMRDRANETEKFPSLLNSIVRPGTPQGRAIARPCCCIQRTSKEP